MKDGRIVLLNVPNLAKDSFRGLHSLVRLDLSNEERWTHPPVRMNTIETDLSIDTQERFLTRHLLVCELALDTSDVLLVYSSVGMTSSEPHSEGFGSFDGEGTHHHAGCQSVQSIRGYGTGSVCYHRE